MTAQRKTALEELVLVADRIREARDDVIMRCPDPTPITDALNAALDGVEAAQNTINHAQCNAKAELDRL